jgi:hypothetical protein
MNQQCHALNLNPSDDGIGSVWITELTQKHTEKLMVETLNIEFAHLLISCDYGSFLLRAAYLVILLITGSLDFMSLCFQYVPMMIFCIQFIYIYITLPILYFLTKKEYLSVSTVCIYWLFLP